MKRTGYREAVWWLADNDDNEWVDGYLQDQGGPEQPSVAACCVADLYGVELLRLTRDLKRKLDQNDGEQ